MITKTWPYGTTYEVVVISSTKLVLAVMEPISKEGFILAMHGLKELPKVGERGKIVFVEGGPTGGHWKYYSLKTNAEA